MKTTDILDLVRFPAVATAPGDALVGASCSRGHQETLPVWPALSSSLLYLAGMAFNDVADRVVDERERPNRPIPSGRVSTRQATAAGTLLMGLGVACAGVSRGKAGLLRSTLLAGAIVTYDFAGKKTPLGPLNMALCRALNVLGAAPDTRRAALPAAVMGLHTLAVTHVSRHEVQGGGGLMAQAAAAISLVTAGASLASVHARPLHRAVQALAVAAYVGVFARTAWQAGQDPTPVKLQRTVGAGVMGMMPLQASLLAGHRRPAVATVLTVTWGLMHQRRTKRSVT